MCLCLSMTQNKLDKKLLLRTSFWPSAPIPRNIKFWINAGKKICKNEKTNSTWKSRGLLEIPN